MVRITIRIHAYRRWIFLFPALVMVLLLSAAGPGSVVVETSQASMPRYYLTKTFYPPDTALTACADGYHMASLWEIYDPSNLAYSFEHPDAYIRGDSGHGPPSESYGWVRTGYVSSDNSTPGRGNCDSWTNVTSGYGTHVALSSQWIDSPGNIGPWLALTVACKSTNQRRVWCVSNDTSIYVPVIFKSN